MTPRDLGLELARSEGSFRSAQRLDVKLRAAGERPASSGAPLAAHPIMPVQVARRRANSRRGSRLGRREKGRRTVNFNDELGRCLQTLTLCPLLKNHKPDTDGQVCHSKATAEVIVVIITRDITPYP